MLLQRLLSGIVTAGIVLASAILWRLVGERRGRWLVAGLAAYGALAFMHATLSGLALRDVLAGHGLLQVLPRVLQGAFVGAFVVLPLGWIASVVRAGIPRFRQGSPQRSIYQAVALTTCAGLVLTSISQERARSRSDSMGGFPESTAARLAILENSVRAIEDGDRQTPRDRWDPGYVVATVGRDPHALFEWVRTNTRWIPYRGVLRGATGVLMDRDGNTLDRSLVLAALLQAAGHGVRLAHGELTERQAADLLSTLVPPVAPPAQTAAPQTAPNTPAATPRKASADLGALAARYSLDGSAIEQTIDHQRAVLEDRQSDLEARVADQTGRILAAVREPERKDERQRRLDASRALLRDHWWVQQREVDRWQDWDLMALQPGESLVAANETMPVDHLPTELHHQVTIRVMAEKSTNGSAQESRVLEHTLRTANQAGRTLMLQFWPTAWPSEVQHDVNGRFGFRAAALDQQQWTVVLTDADQPLAHGILRDAPDTEAPSSPFTSIARAFASQSASGSSHASSTALSAVWVEYDLHGPGAPVQSIRRAVFDLRGPSKRARGLAFPLPVTDGDRLTRGLALMSRIEILVVGSGLAPEFVAHLASKAAVSGSRLIRSLSARESSDVLERVKTEMAGTTPQVSPLCLLSLVRFGWTAVPSHVLVDRPNVLTRHRYPAVGPAGLDVKAAFDIVANEIGLDLTIDGGFAARVRQGVVDTNAEALLSAEPSTSNTADQFAASRDWLAIDPHTVSALDRLPLSDDARGRITKDVEQGFAVVAPRSAIAGGHETAGWWRIDAVTGDTLGIGVNGWGMGPEDSALFNMAVSAASGFTFEYTLCQAFPQGMNLLKYLNARYVGWEPSWAKASKPQSVGEVLEENNTVCLVTAIASGIVATLPILLMTIKVRNMRIALRLAEEAAAKEAEAQALKQWEKELMELPGFDVNRPNPPQIKTQVWPNSQEEAFKNTMLPPRPPNSTELAEFLRRREAIERATAAMNRSQQELNVSMEEYLSYQTGRKPPQYGGRFLDPTHNPEVEAALRARAELDFGRYSETVDELQELLAPGRNGRPPGPRPTPPTPIGNNNVTLGDPQLVGAAGAGSAFGK